MLLHIDIDRLISNIRTLSRGYPYACLVVKANAYGHGYDIARYIEGEVDYLAVATADEGAMLRDIGISIPILVLGVDSIDTPTIVDYHLTPVVYSASHIEGLPRGYEVHIKVDSGMHRYGLHPADLVGYARDLIDRGLVVRGVCTHIYSTSSIPSQVKIFNEACDSISNICPSVIRHLSSTSSVGVGGDMLRLGIGAYTHSTVMKVSMQVLNIQRLMAGDTAGYDGVFRAERDSVVAIVSGGYADGIRRSEIGRGYVSYLGHRLKIVGVCMDCTLVDVTGVDIYIGDEVWYLSSEVDLHDIASRQDTIPYEVLTSFGARAKRRYYENNSRRI
ncbi:MAG: alanine racemase [Clostridia bacterium]|nr:alanine racemase [Clostridia bacterium]